MTRPRLPLPVAMQYTRTVLAITMTKYMLDLYTESIDTDDFLSALKRVRFAADVCFNEHPRKRLSKGAKHDLDAAFHTFSDRIMQVETLPESERIRHIAALWWTALSQVTCVTVTCPNFCNNRAWHNLEERMIELGNILEDVLPGCAEKGTQFSFDLP